MCVLGLADAHLTLGVESAGIRCIQDEADGAAERARSIQRTLRAAQHLDTIQVLKSQVEEQRRVVDISRDRRDHRSREPLLKSGGFAVESANDKGAAVHATERTGAGAIDTGNR